MVERAGFENQYTCKGIEGSNPSASALLPFEPVCRQTGLTLSAKAFWAVWFFRIYWDNYAEAYGADEARWVYLD